ncbi:hypothetical protein PDE_08633 [Penicillium oxalicum 114-2]|uniref:Uncharacterized protein n=1 Tax=Penicillium oxalicum (strain 114-2 / CGMCC 5302) TaxID=933388 RepID=S7ZXY3_PENO1|nr:hypothetical protein PDE_08633 [Penicillium oxalicum 114-2]
MLRVCTGPLPVRVLKNTQRFPFNCQCVVLLANLYFCFSSLLYFSFGLVPFSPRLHLFLSIPLSCYSEFVQHTLSLFPPTQRATIDPDNEVSKMSPGQFGEIESS